jgi:hypothetical protein
MHTCGSARVHTLTHEPTAPMPVAAVTPLLPKRLPAIPAPRKPGRHLPHTRTGTDDTGIPTAAGTPGEHAAGLLDTDLATREPAEHTERLVADVTLALQTYAALAPITRYSDLLPHLAAALVDHGWITKEATGR